MRTAETLRAARWFGGKSRHIASTHELDRACLADGAPISLLEVRYRSGPSETYVLVDDVEAPEIARGILQHFKGATIDTERGGKLIFQHTHVFNSIASLSLEPVTLLRGEQSNTSIRFGNALILKLFRRLQFGPNPDVEIGWFLTERTVFRATPPVVGSLTYVTAGGEEASLAMLQQFEPNRGDAWTTTLRRVRDVFLNGDMTESAEAARRLGATTAELHLALASGRESAFAPEPISADDIHNWSSAVQEEVRITVEALSSQGMRVDASALQRRARGLEALEGSLKARHHGDYHLGQVLEREDAGFVIIDFEGEPSRPLAQRREKRTPLRDVAGMLRSFDYARHAALRTTGGATAYTADLAERWYTSVREAFLTDYVSVARRHPRLIPEEINAPLDALELEKAAYEVMYELNNRPDWLPIPLAAFDASACRG